jgi:hypothetical protein
MSSLAVSNERKGTTAFAGWRPAYQINKKLLYKEGLRGDWSKKERCCGGLSLNIWLKTSAC